MNRRTFIGSSSLWVAVAGGAIDARVTDAGARLAAVLRDELPAQTLDDLHILATRLGWGANAPERGELRTRIASDFRANRTVVVRRVRLSLTEAAWMLTRAKV